MWWSLAVASINFLGTWWSGGSHALMGEGLHQTADTGVHATSRGVMTSLIRFPYLDEKRVRAIGGFIVTVFFAITGIILAVEFAERFTPLHEINSRVMLYTSVLSLIGNLQVARLYHQAEHYARTITHRGPHLHNLFDLGLNACIIFGAIAIEFQVPYWRFIDFGLYTLALLLIVGMTINQGHKSYKTIRS